MGAIAVGRALVSRFGYMKVWEVAHTTVQLRITPPTPIGGVEYHSGYGYGVEHIQGVLRFMTAQDKGIRAIRAITSACLAYIKSYTWYTAHYR